MNKIKRKIIKQGHNTLTITLPREWSSKYQLKAGDDVDINEQGNILTIGSHQGLSLPEITLDLRGLTPLIIWRYILSAYRAGYDEFKVLFDNLKNKERYTAFSYDTINFLHTSQENNLVLSPIEVIQAVVNRLIGIEIIDQKENYFIIKEMGEISDKEFDNALRRIFLLLLSLSEEILKSIKEGGKSDFLKSVSLYDNNIDRFTDFCLRVLNKKGYKDFRKTPSIYSTIFILEMLGDELKKIAIHLMEAKQTTKHIESLFKIQYEQLRRYYNLFYGFNKEKISEIYSEDKKGHAQDVSAFASLNNDEKELLHHLKKIGIYLTSLTELRLDMEH